MFTFMAWILGIMVAVMMAPLCIIVFGWIVYIFAALVTYAVVLPFKAHEIIVAKFRR